MRKLRWLTPELVIRLRFTAWTDRGNLRHANYLGEVDDVDPQRCVDTSPAPEPDMPERTSKATNPDQVFWPAVGRTKGDLFAYYTAIAPRIPPWLRGRPVSLVRFPDGVEGEPFHQTNTPT